MSFVQSAHRVSKCDGPTPNWMPAVRTHTLSLLALTVEPAVSNVCCADYSRSAVHPASDVHTTVFWCFCIDWRSCLACPAAESRPAGYMFCFCFCFCLFFDDFCLTNYFKIHQTDLCKIFGVCRTMAVDDLFEISFSIPQWTLP